MAIGLGGPLKVAQKNHHFFLLCYSFSNFPFYSLSSFLDKNFKVTFVLEAKISFYQGKIVERNLEFKFAMVLNMLTNILG